MRNFNTPLSGVNAAQEAILTQKIAILSSLIMPLPKPAQLLLFARLIEAKTNAELKVIEQDARDLRDATAK